MIFFRNEKLLNIAVVRLISLTSYRVRIRQSHMSACLQSLSKNTRSIRGRRTKEQLSYSEPLSKIQDGSILLLQVQTLPLRHFSKRWFSDGGRSNTAGPEFKSTQVQISCLDTETNVADTLGHETVTPSETDDFGGNEPDITRDDLSTETTELEKYKTASENPPEVNILAEQPTPFVLDEFIPTLLPAQSMTLASYVGRSVTLQKLVELGVDLSKVEKKAEIGTSLLKLDFERDIKDKVVLLHQVGVSGEALGRLLTVNPFILTEELVNLEARLQYLRSKMFSEEAITQVVMRAPYFLSFSVERIDSKLGFFQKELSLTGDEVRHIITATPKLVTFKIQRVKENIFVFRRQLGFSPSELKKLILREPRLLLRAKEKVISTFDYLHNHMGIPHKQLMTNPQVFNGRGFRFKERHKFLEQQGLAQYDPTQPGYISLQLIAKFPDEVFCRDVAKSSMTEYNKFLKTL